jgi:hypothetical protein
MIGRHFKLMELIAVLVVGSKLHLSGKPVREHRRASNECHFSSRTSAIRSVGGARNVHQKAEQAEAAGDKLREFPRLQNRSGRSDVISMLGDPSRMHSEINFPVTGPRVRPAIA